MFIVKEDMDIDDDATRTTFKKIDDFFGIS